MTRNERGSTLVVVALATTGMLSMLALAVDVGMLFTARGEAQRVADAAALAGAASFIEAPDDGERARRTAVEFAAQNTVRNAAVALVPEDVEVNQALWQVEVTVRRTAARGNAIATWFARLFGVDEVDVAARATAEAAPAGAGVCMKPFAVPDAWDDTNGNDRYDDGENYAIQETGYGTDFRNGQPDDDGNVYTNDFGRPIVLKEGTPQEAIVPSWYFPWDVPQTQGNGSGNGNPAVGADRYRWNIANCNMSLITLGTSYLVETGNMSGPTRQGVEGLIDDDPDARWDARADSVVNSDYQPWKASPRVINLPLFDPTQPIESGKNPIVFNNITAFFLEGTQGRDVIGRFLYASGVGSGPGGAGAAGTGPQIKFVRLIE
ncbi:MAG: pilus assembly protein TadG-related protein [Actinobacteria bacterium]|nr:pilus assembly protein TadG-related protein [Actinomycetota bacterium]